MRSVDDVTSAAAIRALVNRPQLYSPADRSPRVHQRLDQHVEGAQGIQDDAEPPFADLTSIGGGNLRLQDCAGALKRDQESSR